jgi:hypothetical protein
VAFLVEKHERTRGPTSKDGGDGPSGIERSAGEIRAAATLLLGGDMAQVGEMAIGAADELCVLAAAIRAMSLHDALESLDSLRTILEVFSNFVPAYLQSKSTIRSAALSTAFCELYVVATELPFAEEMYDGFAADVESAVAVIRNSASRILKVIHKRLSPAPLEEGLGRSDDVRLSLSSSLG